MKSIHKRYSRFWWSCGDVQVGAKLLTHKLLLNHWLCEMMLYDWHTNCCWMVGMQIDALLKAFHSVIFNVSKFMLLDIHCICCIQTWFWMILLLKTLAYSNSSNFSTNVVSKAIDDLSASLHYAWCFLFQS